AENASGPDRTARDEDAAGLDFTAAELLVDLLAGALSSRFPEATNLSIRAEIQDRQTCIARPGAPVRRNRARRARLICRVGVPQGIVSAGRGADSLEALKAGDP